MKISHKILVIITIGIVMSATFAIIAFQVGTKGTRTLESIYHENVTPLDNVRNMQLMFRELEFRMTGTQADVVAAIGSGTHLEQSIKDIDASWMRVKDAVEHYDLSNDAIEAIETYEKGYAGFKENVVPPLLKVYFDNEPEGVADLYDEWLDYKPVVMKSMDAFADILKADVKEYYNESQRNVSKINKIIVIIAVIGIGLFAAFALFVVRSINRPIQIVVQAAEEVARGDLTHTIKIDSKDEMGHMAQALNTMILHLREAFGEIVDAVEHISSNTEGLSTLSEKLLAGVIRQNDKGKQIDAASTVVDQTVVGMAQNSANASEAVQKSNNIAAAGKEVVNSTVESITKLAGSVSESSAMIYELGSSLEEIGGTVSVIQDIANQTNLLALNAAIEAARSGEYGRGFAVVADEVRKLADRTSKATDEISSKIHAIHEESEQSIVTIEKGRLMAAESVANATKAGEVLQQIVDSSENVMSMVQSVTSATEEQSTASEEVSRNMEDISEIIKDHVTLAENIEMAACDLAQLAQGVIVQTAYFKTKDTGNTDPVRKNDETVKGGSIPKDAGIS